MKPILIFLGIILMFIGFFIVTLGLILPSSQIQENQNYEKYNEYNNENEKSNVEYSGIIMIGPIPIVFGNSPGLIILSILITILMIVWIFLFAFGIRIK
ncbi:TIGR00304 family protein [Methanocaldococcus sp.]|uniref:TIGR00304 family membrane protein n=1 Tax=Methanocaldococcus sp. TaxID=2152917 RepID=UPI002611E191|nr:TIGR00304 family protein [Methanocaldococcus sp.]MCQ6253796.1 TIGR00304 family protein [Methanocaldococcus sp.]